MNNFDEFVEYGWDDEISVESNFALLPEGDYNFKITKFERARFAGSEKMPPCNMAKVTFEVYGEKEKTVITENYFVCNWLEWKLSQLFLSVGLKKHGEPLKMSWNALVGKEGKCHVYIDTFIKKDGKEGQANKIRKLYAYDEQVTTVKPSSQPAASNGGWNPGVF